MPLDLTSPTTCDACGTGGRLYLHSRCHIEAPLWAIAEGDILILVCAECEREVARFLATPVPSPAQSTIIHEAQS